MDVQNVAYALAFSSDSEDVELTEQLPWNDAELAHVLSWLAAWVPQSSASANGPASYSSSTYIRTLTVAYASDWGAVHLSPTFCEFRLYIYNV